METGSSQGNHRQESVDFEEAGINLFIYQQSLAQDLLPLSDCGR